MAVFAKRLGTTTHSLYEWVRWYGAEAEQHQAKADGQAEIRRLQKVNSEDFQCLTNASKKVFPDLELFAGLGIFAQNLEGRILKQVMLEGIKKDIVCLPVHDAPLGV